MNTRKRPRRIGLYGGSFDPIHLGHLLPVEETRARLGLDTVLFVPAFAPPHKPTGPSAPAFHRFAMAALALAPYEHFRLSDFEATRGGTTYTVETLRHMRALEPEAEIVLVVGSDSCATLPSWRAYREILEDYRIAAVYREPWDWARLKAETPRELSGRMAPEGATLDEAPEEATVFWGGNAPVTISSTWLRRAISEGADPTGSLPPAVETYLRRQRLYLPPSP